MCAALTRGNNEQAKTPMIYHTSEVDNTVCCVQVVTDTPVACAAQEEFTSVMAHGFHIGLTPGVLKEAKGVQSLNLMVY